MRKLFVAILFTLCSFSNSKAQSLDFEIDPYVNATGDTLFIDYYVTNNGFAAMGFGPTDLPIELDTNGLDVNNVVVTNTGRWDAVNTPAHYSPMAVGFSNDSVINLQIIPFYNPPASDPFNAAHPVGAFLAAAEVDAYIGTIGIPITSTCDTTNINWVPLGLPFSGARLQWDGTDVTANTVFLPNLAPNPILLIGDPLYVINNNDAGCGSLREAINYANTNPGPDTITFDPGFGATINLLSPLPPITGDSTVIIGEIDGVICTPDVEIDGTTAGAGAVGIHIQMASSVEIIGLNIRNFSSDGIQIEGPNATLNKIYQCFIGTNALGTLPAGNTGNGIRVFGGAFRTVIGGNSALNPCGGTENIISSANGLDGITIEAGCDSTTILGAIIGTNLVATGVMGNGDDGVHVDGCTGTFVGFPGSNNIMNNNGGNGIHITGGSFGTGMVQNIIGLDATNSDAGNVGHGISIVNSDRNAVGISILNANQIAGNGLNGVNIDNSDSCSIVGNLIGMNSTSTAVPNDSNGIAIKNSNGTVIGTPTANGANVISGNTVNGIMLTNSDSTNIRLNVIGLDLTFSLDRGNGADGINVSGGSIQTRIGDGTQSGRNIISGNDDDGIHFIGATSSFVRGNFIGLDITGFLDVGNSGSGIYLQGSSNNQIGGTNRFDRNIVSGNNFAGIFLSGGASSNIIYNNFAGTDSTGLGAVPNTQDGVRLGNVDNNIIGGNGTFEGNLLSGNSGNGARFGGGAGNGDNVLEGNLIGTDSTGLQPLPNGSHGVEIVASHDADTVRQNTIAFNTTNGVSIDGATSVNHIVHQNSIFSNGALGIAHTTGSQEGIIPPVITAINIVGSDTIIVGTSAPSAYIQIFCDSTHEGQAFLADTVATPGGAWQKNINGLGIFSAGNGLDSLTALQDSAGGTSEFSVPFAKVLCDPLIVTNNGDDGSCGTFRGAINAANLPGPDTIVFTGSFNITTGSSLPIITDDSTFIAGDINSDCIPDQIIDGAGAGADITGIEVLGADYVTIQGLQIINFQRAATQGHGIHFNNSNFGLAISNFIGTDGAIDVGNQGHGVFLSQNSRYNTIGLEVGCGRSNIISGNDLSGIFTEVGSDSNFVFTNWIGTDSNGAASIANTVHGVALESNGNFVGSITIDSANLISGNTLDGININGGDGNVIEGNFIGVDSSLNTALANGADGIRIVSASFNVIGTNATGNVISGNSGNGIHLVGPGTDTNAILGNTIGLGQDEVTPVGNTVGILFNDADNNFVGDGSAGAGNIISGNNDAGINFTNGSDDNQVLGNIIGPDITGAIIGGHPNGGIIVQASAGTIIGNVGLGSRNVISGNTTAGVVIDNADTTVLMNNFIGTNLTGLGATGNFGPGILTQNNAFTVIVGGVLATQGNVISGNQGAGFEGITGSNTIAIFNNYIGVDSTGNAGLGNGGDGVRFAGTSGFNIVGDTSAPNIISGNTDDGVDYNNADSSYIVGNNIGLALNGTSSIPNGSDGIELSTGSEVDSIAFNNVAYNSGHGIRIDDPTSIHNIVWYNSIFSNNQLGISHTASQEGIPAPRINSFVVVATDTIVSGTAAPGALIQIFCDSTHEGQALLDTAIADGAGNWSKIVNGYGIFQANGLDSLTALQDSSDNTSPFSVPFAKTLCVPPTVDLGPTDTGFCANDSVMLAVFDYGLGSIYTWYSSPGAPTVVKTSATNTDTIYYASTVDTFWVEVDSGGAGCLAYDTIIVNQLPTAVVNLPATLAFCSGDSVSITVPDYGPFSVYQWFQLGVGLVKTSANNADVDYYTSVADTFVVTVDSASTGCLGMDTVIVTTTSRPVVNVGQDTSICTSNDTVTLAVNDYGVGSVYTWIRSGAGVQKISANNTDTTYDATINGQYIVEVDSLGLGCVGRDTINIAPLPTVPASMNVVLQSISSNSATFRWDSIPGSTGYILHIDTCASPGYACTTLPVDTVGPDTLTWTQPLNVFDSAYIWVEIVHPCGMLQSDTAAGMADSCNASFSGLDSTYCTSSFLEKLFPVKPGGVFTATPVPNAVKYAGPPNNFWYFDPAEAGVGTHMIYYSDTSCIPSAVDSFETTVQGAPCVDDVVNDSTSSAIKQPRGLFTDCDGQIYTASNAIDALVKIDTFGFASVIAGDSTSFGFVDGHISVALLNSPIGLAVDPSGIVYFVDGGNHAVRMVRNDTVITIAGTGGAGFADGVPGAVAQFNQPFGLALSNDLTKLYVTEEHRVREIDLASAPLYNVSTLAGSIAGVAGDFPGIGIAARLREPRHVVADANYVYVADQGNRRIKRIDIVTQNVENYILSGGFGINDGHRTDPLTTSFQPVGISVDAAGTVYFSDEFACAVRKMEDDTVTRFAGAYGLCGDVSGTAFQARFDNPGALSVFVRGFLDVADVGNDKIKRIAIQDFLKSPLSPVDSIYCINDAIDTIAPTSFVGTYSGPGIDSTGGNWRFNPALAGPGNHNVCFTYTIGYCTDSLCESVLVSPLPTPNLGPDTTLCTTSVGVDSFNVDSNLASIQWVVNGVADPADTNWYLVKDTVGQFIVLVTDTNGCSNSDTANITIASTVVVEIQSDMNDTICYGSTATLTATNIGTGPGFTSFIWNTGDTTSSINSNFTGDFAVSVVDSTGCPGDTTFRNVVRNAPNVCIKADSGLVGPSGARYGEWEFTTLAGDTNLLPGSVNGNGYAASFNTPWDVLYHNGNLYVTENSDPGLIRQIRLTDTLVTTFAGDLAGTINDSVPRLGARLGDNKGIVISPDSNFFYFVMGNRIMVLDVARDSIYRFANWAGGVGAADGYRLNATLNEPRDIAIDGFGNIAIAEFSNMLVRVLGADDTVRTLVGQLFNAGLTPGLPAVSRANSPFGVEFAPNGDLWIGHEQGHATTKVTIDSVQSTTVSTNNVIANTLAPAGNNAYFTKLYSHDASQGGTWNIVTDKTGKMYITEGLNHYISVVDQHDSLIVISGDYGGAPTTGWVDGLGGPTRFNTPTGITLDLTTNTLYIADRGNHLIRSGVQNKTIQICSADSVTLDGTCSAGASYQWTLPSALTVASPSITVNAPGTYILEVTDGFGCTNTDSIIVQHYPTPVVNSTPDTTICEGDSIDLVATPGFTTYSWTGPSLFTSNNDTITIADSGQYIVTATDANGCVAMDTTNVSYTVMPVLPPIAVPDQCVGDKFTIDFPPAVDAMVTNYLWSDSTTADTFCVFMGGIYSVDLTLTNGCTTTLTDTITFNLPPTVSITSAPAKSASNLFVGTLATGFNKPRGVVEASNGDLFVADFGGHVIRRVDKTTGIVTVFAGQLGTPGLTDGVGIAAQFSHPRGIDIDQYDNLYVADMDSNVIRKITPAGVVTTYAGVSYDDDPLLFPATFNDGASSSALFRDPQDVAVDGSGRIWISDAGNNVIRIIDPVTKIVASVGVASGVGSNTNGPFAGMTFNNPQTIISHESGAIFVGETGVIRALDLSVGAGINFNLGTNGPDPYGIGTEVTGLHVANGNLLIASVQGPNNILEASNTNNTSIAGTPPFAGFVDGWADTARFNAPYGMVFGNDGVLYITDDNNNALRTLYDSCHVSMCTGDTVALNATASSAGGVYMWSTGSGSSMDTAFTGGTYWVQYTDPGTGCSAFDSIYVNEFPIPTFSFVTPDTTICSSGTVDLIASATTPGDTIIWLDPVGTPISFGINSDTINVDSSMLGTYTARVVGASGCSYDSTVTVTVNDLQAIAGGVIGPDTVGACFGDTMTLSAQLSNSGVPFTAGLPYTYSWTGTGGNVIGASNLDTVVGTSGALPLPSFETYYADVTDSLGCTQTDSVVVYWNDSLFVDAGNDTAICLGSSVSLTGVPGGGTTPYTSLQWFDSLGGPVLLNGNTLNVIPTDTTTYYVIVTDSAGCTALDSVTVFTVTPIVDAGADDTICNGANTLLTATPIVGIGPFSYAWTPSASLDDSTLQSPTASPTVTTQYIVSMYDSAIACAATDTVNVIVNDLQAIAGLVDGINGDTINVCFGDSAALDGALTNGGIGLPVNFTYLWMGSGTATIVSNGLQNTQAHSGTLGSYEQFDLIVTDSAGCVDTDSLVVYWNTQIIADGIPDTAYSCSGNPDSISASAVGGTAPYAYAWSTTGTAVVAGPFDSATTVTATDTSLFILQVLDGLGCQAFDSNTVMGVNFVVDATVQYDTICVGINDTLNAQIISGGSGTYSFAWSPAATLNDSTLQMPFALPTGTTMYTVAVYDSVTGCSTSDSVQIVINNLDAIAGIGDGLAGDTINVCFGDTAQLDASLTSGGFPGVAGYNYAWSSTTFVPPILNLNSQIAQATGGIAGSVDVFVVDVTDSVGCQELDSVAVFWNPQLIADGQPDTAYSCLGNPDSIAAVPTGGTGPYSYAWTTIAPGAAVIAGPTDSATTVSTTDTSQVELVITDNLGCTAVDTITVMGIDLQVSATAQFDTVCPGLDDTLYVTITSGGVGPFGYLWTPTATLSDSTNDTTVANTIITTTYTVTVYDSTTGCSAMDMVTVNIRDLTAIAGAVDGLVGDTINMCFGDTALLRGDLTNGGQPFAAGYNFAWTADVTFTGTLLNAANDTANAFGGTQGTYDLFFLDVTDSLACTDRDTVAVFWNPQLTVNGLPDSAYSCSGAVDSIHALPVGGSQPWSYNWLTLAPGAAVIGNATDSATTVSTNDTSFVQLTITDNVGCTALDTITVFGVNFSVNATAQYDTVCPNFNDTLNVSITTGGAGPYSYLWSPGATLDDSLSAQVVANTPVTTTYTVMVYDSMTECSANDAVTVVINPLITIAGLFDGLAGDTVVACFGDTIDIDGTLTSGGTQFSGSPYQFNWTFPGATLIIGAATDSAVQAHSGPANTFTQFLLNVTDSLGCTDADSMMVYWNDQLTVAANPTDTLFVCAGDTGQVLGTSAGGTLSHTLNWSVLNGTATLLNTTGSPLDVILTDTSDVMLTVTDSVSCTATDTMTVLSIPFQIQIDETSDSICVGQSDTLTATVVVGVGPYGYSWNTGSTTDTIMVIPPATGTVSYSVTVLDSATGCSQVANQDIFTYDMSVFAGNDTTLCNSGAVLPTCGAASITSGFSPFTIAWDKSGDPANLGILDTTLLCTQIVPDTFGLWVPYYLKVTDKNGCFRRDTINIFTGPPFVAAPSPPAAASTVCVGDSIRLNTNGPTLPLAILGSPPYTQVWNSVPVTPVVGSTAQNPWFFPTASGSVDFSALVTDTLGCQVTFNQTITVTPLPLIDLGLDTFYCQNDSILLENQLTDPGLTYTWTAGCDTCGAVYGTDSTLYVDSVATYYATVQDGGTGCSTYDSVAVTEQLAPVITINPPGAATCSNAPIGLSANINVTGGSLIWTTPNGLGSFAPPNDTVTTYNPPGGGGDPSPITFRVDYTTFCGTDIDSISVATLSGPVAGFIPNPTSIFPGNTVTFTDTSTGATVYDWTFGTNAVPDTATNAGPHNISYANPGLQTVTLIVLDGSGCTDTATYILDVVSTKVLYIPNVMAPMANNVENQCAKVYGVNISNTDFRFSIYNRWGELIYETTDFTTANTVGWNGFHYTTNEAQDKGVYTYSLQGQFYDGEKFEKTGTITLIR